MLAVMTRALLHAGQSLPITEVHPMVSRFALYPMSLECSLSINLQNLDLIFAKTLTIKGFLQAKLEAQAEDPSNFYKQMAALVESGQMKWNECIYEGLEMVGEVILAVQKGDNTAKAVVKVAGQ